MSLRSRKRVGANGEAFFPLTSDVARDHLKNGMNILVKQVYPASVINLAVWVKVGSIYETHRIAGISHFIEHMLFKGTDKRVVGQIAKEIHGCGGYLNAFTDLECTCYWIVLPSKYLDLALEVQSDALLHSTFDEGELHKECQVIIEELKMYEDRPEAFAFEKLMALAFKKHPYGRPIIGFEETLRGITRQDLVDYYRHHYSAGNMFVTLVGDVNPVRVHKKIKEAFQEVALQPVPETSIEVEPEQTSFRTQELHGDIASSYLQMGFHVPNAVHSDYYALRLLGTMLGDGRSSRLSISLREKKQLVDDLEAGVFSQQNPGIFYISLMLEDRNIAEAQKTLWGEIEKLRQELVPEEELLKTKNMTESTHIFSQETVEGQGRNLGYYEVLGDYTLGERFVSNLSSVTSEEIRKVVQKYFSRENCSEILYHSKGKG